MKTFERFGFLNSFLDEQIYLYSQSYNIVFWVENSTEKEKNNWVSIFKKLIVILGDNTKR